MKRQIWRQYPVGEKAGLFERPLDCGVLAPSADAARAITRNRQPGRCCDMAASPPGQAMMLPMPASQGMGRVGGEDLDACASYLPNA